jgi:hypothetical protein
MSKIRNFYVKFLFLFSLLWFATPLAPQNTSKACFARVGTCYNVVSLVYTTVSIIGGAILAADNYFFNHRLYLTTFVKEILNLKSFYPESPACDKISYKEFPMNAGIGGFISTVILILIWYFYTNSDVKEAINPTLLIGVVSIAMLLTTGAATFFYVKKKRFEDESREVLLD